MRVEVLGTGCPKCNMLENDVKKVLAELGLEAQVVKVTDIEAIVERGIMMTPGLVVDGKVVAEGKLPNTDQLRQLLKKHGK